MYKSKGILTDELARQNPVKLMEMLISLNEDEEENSVTNLPPSLGWMNGL